MQEAKPQLKDLYRTGPEERKRIGYLRLDKNESVSGLPAEFIKEVLYLVNPEFLATYPEYRTLKEKIASHSALQAENICLSNGSDAAIKYIFDAYVSSGDRILLTNPTFAMYLVYCEMFGMDAMTVEYKPDFTFPVEDFIDKISQDINIAVIVNPNNPTGIAVKQPLMDTIIKKARDNNVLMIVDEAYFYFYPHSVIEKVKTCENLIVLRTFSKLCGIACARLGYAAACPEIIENLKRVRPTYDVNGLAALFAEKMLDRPDVIQSLIRRADAGKRYLTQRLSEENIEYREGLANFVLIKCSERIDEITGKLAEKNILVGSGFKQGLLKDYIRVTTGDKAVMERFWRSFIEIWKM